MAHPTAVILIVGLTRGVLGPNTPHLKAFADAGEVRTLRPVLPAVTCSVQASMLTGLGVRDHGIVGNGWLDRDLGEVHFWKQSNRLVRGEKLWETARAREPGLTTANICWWYNMYSSVEYSVTPRPIYRADGRKIPDCHSHPADLRDRVQAELGPFPLFQFWGPGASIRSSKWIADAATLVVRWHDPSLTLVYLPHLDYAHQKFGPDAPESRLAAGEIDAVFGELLAFLRSRAIRPIVVSEYGIEPVDRPIAINRALREAGFVSIRNEQGRDAAEPGASAAFAVADHQVAHVYVRDRAQRGAVRAIVEALPGVEMCLDRDGQRAMGIDHARSGDLVAVAAAGSWFTYGWWRDDARAPDYARTVDIHRKPGYDPLELFMDPALRWPRLTLARKLLLRKIGLRTLMDIVPLDAGLVRGSHGRVDMPEARRPVMITERGAGAAALGAEAGCEAVRDTVMSTLFGPPAAGAGGHTSS